MNALTCAVAHPGTSLSSKSDIQAIHSYRHVSDLLSLFNLSSHPPEKPLLLHLPALPLEGASPATPPSFLQDWPVASINYRWGTGDQSFVNENNATTPLQWPTPVHDTAFAYSWIVSNLAPEGNQRRDIYAYGSYLGASLAASLSLTECQPHVRFGVRGFAAYNGVYNWTMFLPGHPMYRRKSTKGLNLAGPLLSEPLAMGSHMKVLLDDMDGLFARPSNAFDPFASPSLFFHSPGMHVPASFDDPAPSPLSQMISLVTGQDDARDAELIEMKPPRKSYMVYPPRTSTLKIPQTLLLHDKFNRSKMGRRWRLTKKHPGNTPKTQAEELAGLMRRSINKVEFGERVKWDDQMDSWEAQALQRVQVAELGEERDDVDLAEDGQERIRAWLGALH